MKSRVLIYLFIVVVLFLVGCGQSSEIDEAEITATPEITASPTPIPTPVPYSFAADSHSLNLNPVESEAELQAFFESCIIEDLSQPETLSPVTVGNGYSVSLHEKEMYIVSLQDSEPILISRVTAGIDWNVQYDSLGSIVSASEKTPLGVYLMDDLLFVISDSYGYITSGTEIQYDEYTVVDTYDISDIYNPVIIATHGQDGFIRDAKLTADGLWVATSYHLYATDGTILPRTYSVYGFSNISTENILLDKNGTNCGYAVNGLYRANSEPLIMALAGVNDNLILTEHGPLYYRNIDCMADSRSFEYQGKKFQEIIQTSGAEIYSLIFDRSSMAVNGITLIGHADNSSFQVIDDGWNITTYMTNQRLGGPEDEIVHGKCSYALDANLRLIGEPLTETADHEVDSRNILLAKDFGQDTILFEKNERGLLEIRYITSVGEEAWCQEFGTDFSASSALDNAVSINSHQNLLCLPATDSYCLYSISDSGLMNLGQDVFTIDNAINSRVISNSDFLYLITTREVLCISPEDYTVLGSLTF